MRKITRIMVLLAALVLVALGCLFGVSGNETRVHATEEPKLVGVMGVQLRADVNSGLYYLVLLTNEYAEVAPDTAVLDSEIETYKGLLAGVTLYTSQTDETGVSAETLCSTSDWRINRWGSGGLMLPMSESVYEQYNGTSVYKISIDKGLSLPFLGSSLIVLEDVSYINEGYGMESSKYSAFSWVRDIPVLPDMDVQVFCVQLRGDAEAGIYYFVMQAEPYANIAPAMTVSDRENYIDLLSKITFYMSDSDAVGISAADIVSEEDWWFNRWTSHGLMLPIDALTWETYNGASVYKVVIEEGAVLPYVKANLKIAQTMVWLNNGYGIDEYKNESFSWELTDKNEALKEEVMAITGVQLRGSVEEGVYYFVVRAENYATVDLGVWVTQTGRFADLLSNIRLYTSEEDTTGISAAEICKSTEWIINRWESHGVMFPMSAEDYELYNGMTVYKVVLEEGLVFPCDKSNLVLQEKSIYINSTYGKEEGKYNGFYWSELPAEILDFGTCSLTDMNNRSNSLTDERWLFLFFTEIFETRQDVSGWVKQLNTLDYIEFYPTEDLTQKPISLREAYEGITIVKQFEQNTAMTFTIKGEYSGANMYMLVVKPGCQIPYIINGECGYRVVENGKSFINDKYGMTGDIFGVYDEMGMPRTYENWGVWWTAVRKVSFKVEGLDDVSYEPRIVAAGDIIDLKDFAVAGYKASLTTANGDRCIGGYIVPDADVELILTYTVDDTPSDSTSIIDWKGCQSVVAGGAIPMGLVLAGVLLKKKKSEGDDAQDL